MLKYLLILAFILRLITINQSLWLDEATSALVVRDLNIPQILHYFSRADFHPPLYYLLLKVWSVVFGTSEIALRLPSVLAGVGTVAIVYKIAEYFNKKTLPMLAGILMATAPLHIYYSQEARMYSLATFFVALSVYLLLQVKDKDKVIRTLGAGSFFALAFLTEYMTIFMLPVLIFMALKTKKLGIRNTVLLMLPFSFASVAIFPLITYQFSAALHVKEMGSLWWNTLGSFSFKNILLVPVKFVIGRIGFESNLLYVLYAGVALAVTGLLAYKAVNKKKKHTLLFVWLLVPPILAIAMSTILPVLYYFRLIFVLPALYLLVGAGLLLLKEKHFMPAFVAILTINILSSAIYFSDSRFHRENWRGMVEHISQDTGNSQVVFAANSQMEAFDYYSGGISRSGPENINPNSDKIWLMRYVQNVFDPQDQTRQKVEQLDFEKIGEHDFNGVAVWEYKSR